MPKSHQPKKSITPPHGEQYEGEIAAKNFVEAVRKAVAVKPVKKQSNRQNPSS